MFDYPKTSLNGYFPRMNWTVLSSWWINILWRLFEGLLVTALSFKLVWIFTVFVLGLFLDFYIMRLKSLLVSRSTFKGYFRFTIEITLWTDQTWSYIYKIGIFLRDKISFIAALSFKLSVLGFVLVYWLVFISDWFWFIAVFVGGLCIKWNFRFSGKVILGTI